MYMVYQLDPEHITRSDYISEWTFYGTDFLDSVADSADSLVNYDFECKRLFAELRGRFNFQKNFQRSIFSSAILHFKRQSSGWNMKIFSPFATAPKYLPSSIGQICILMIASEIMCI